MKLIASYDQHELGLTSLDDRPIDHTRHAARAVVIEDKKQVAMMHFTTTGSYKLPGGGIDDGEAIEVALRREVREEIGHDIDDIRELGIVKEDRYYCGMHQISYCYLVTAARFVGTDRTEREIAEGMETIWLKTIEKAIGAVEGNRLINESDDNIGLKMMKMRETAILRAAQAKLFE